MTYLTHVTCAKCNLVNELIDGICEFCRLRVEPQRKGIAKADVIDLALIAFIFAVVLIAGPMLAGK